MARGSTACASAGSNWGHSTLSLTDGSNPPGTTSISENISYACGTPGFEFARSWSTAAGPLPAYCTSPIDYTTPEATMCGWLSSPTHRPTIADPDQTHIGSGTATVTMANGSVERFATHVFTHSTPTEAPTPMADVSCDGRVDISDALMIAQYTSGARSDAGSCSFSNPDAQLNASRGDVNGDGATTIVDALMVARCVVGAGACP